MPWLALGQRVKPAVRILHERSAVAQVEPVVLLLEHEELSYAHIQNPMNWFKRGRVLSELAIPFTLLSASELRREFPVMRADDGDAAFLEPRGGALMARRAVQFLAADLAADGVTFFAGSVSPRWEQERRRDDFPFEVRPKLSILRKPSGLSRLLLGDLTA